MNYPVELLYSKTHEWVKEEDGVVVIGISDFAQDALGDLVFINLPEVGDEVQIDVRGKKLKAAIVTRHMKVAATHAIPVVYGV